MKFTSDEIRDLCTPTGGRFAVVDTAAAYHWCRRLALGHYENFPVGSVLIPTVQRPHFFAVYAFSRVADDIADEPGFSQEERALLLQQYETLLRHHSTAGSHPIFRSLDCTIRDCQIPLLPLLQLLEAFRRDVYFTRPVTMDDVYDYCTYSANPVGEMVLRIAGCYSKSNHELSNAICTGLQMVNFWQDTSTDLLRGRNYYPITMSKDVSFDIKDLGNEKFCTNFPSILVSVLEATDHQFTKGMSLINVLPTLRLRSEIALTVVCGRYIASQVRQLGTDIIQIRPALSVNSLPSVLFGTLKLLMW